MREWLFHKDSGSTKAMFSKSGGDSFQSRSRMFSLIVFQNVLWMLTLKVVKYPRWIWLCRLSILVEKWDNVRLSWSWYINIEAHAAHCRMVNAMAKFKGSSGSKSPHVSGTEYLESAWNHSCDGKETVKLGSWRRLQWGGACLDGRVLRLVVWLVDFVSWFVCLLDLVGWFDWLIGWRGRFVGLIGWLVDLVGWLVWLVDWLVDSLIGGHWLGWPLAWLVDLGWLIGWLVYQMTWLF